MRSKKCKMKKILKSSFRPFWSARRRWKVVFLIGFVCVVLVQTTPRKVPRALVVRESAEDTGGYDIGFIVEEIPRSASSTVNPTKDNPSGNQYKGLINVTKSQNSKRQKVIIPREKDLHNHDFVKKKLDILQKISLTPNVFSDNARKDARGRNSSVICTDYNREGKEEFHRNRTVFPQIWNGLHSFTSDDVTLVTQMTLGKLTILEKVARQWLGPISIAIHLTAVELRRIKHTFSKHRSLLSRSNLDVSLVLAKGEFYPVNFLRNVAWNQTKTTYVFLSDVDFVPNPDLRGNLMHYIHEGLLDNKTALVVPAFEFLVAPVKSYPSKKEDLLDAWSQNILRTFHAHFQKGHRRTDFEYWKTAAEPYLIDWEDGFEPYLVVRTDTVRYRTQLLGRIRNKTSHTTELHYRGYRFMVLPNGYVIHYPHKRSRRPYFVGCSYAAYYQLKIRLKRLNWVGDP